MAMDTRRSDGRIDWPLHPNEVENGRPMTIPELFKLDAIVMLNTLEKMPAEEFKVIISDLTDDEFMKIAGELNLHRPNL